MWVARDENSDLILFSKKPKRFKNFYQWFIRNNVKDVEGWDYFLVPNNPFPNLKWEDEPLEVELVEVKR